MSEPDTTVEPGLPRLGEWIALEDLLALPPDGTRYERDEGGRLRLMSPDHAEIHRDPLAVLAAMFHQHLHLPAWRVVPEPTVAFEPIFSCRGRALPRSRSGRVKGLEPDLAVFSGRPTFVPARPGGPGRELYAPIGLRLVVEVLSKRTWRQDLGQGRRDEVDRWRTYLENGVPELWLVNAGLEGVPLPPRSALFLRSRDRQDWEPLPGDALRHLEGGVRGLAPVSGGRISSAAAPGLVLDLDAFWAELAAP